CPQQGQGASPAGHDGSTQTPAPQTSQRPGTPSGVREAMIAVMAPTSTRTDEPPGSVPRSSPPPPNSWADSVPAQNDTQQSIGRRAGPSVMIRPTKGLGPRRIPVIGPRAVAPSGTRRRQR